MRTPFALLFFLVACAGASELAPPSPTLATATQSVQSDDGEMQGRHLLGEIPDTLGAEPTRHFRVSVQAITPSGQYAQLSVSPAGSLGANGANLIASDGARTFAGADSRFVGMVMNGIGGGQLRITAVAPQGSSTLYTLDYLAPGASAWAPYCDTTEAQGSIALHGSFTRTRIHENTPDTITFGCRNGVAEKCSLWGYIAGTAGEGDDNWDHHQACIQMANAAYCGAGPGGLPFTREETPIVIQDFVPGYAKGDPDLPHPDPFPGDPDTFYFEAAWLPRGKAPLCVSRIRWQALPPKPCPDQLADPRSDPDPEVKFCDDMTYQEMRSAGALLINGSRMSDAVMHRWRNPSTQDEVTTIRGFYVNRNGDTSGSIVPFPGYTEHVAVDGMILRNLTGTLDADTDMVRLYVQHSTTPTEDLVVSDGALLPDHDYDPALKVDFEGYAFQRKDVLPDSPLQELKVCPMIAGYDTTREGSCTSATPQAMYALPAP